MKAIPITFAVCIVLSITILYSQSANSNDLTTLYGEMKEENRLLKERIERLQLENKSLKAEVASLKKKLEIGKPSQPSTPNAGAVNQTKMEAPIPTLSDTKIRLGELINLQAIGGPNIKLGIKSFEQGIARVLIGTDPTVRKVEVKGEKTLIYRDSFSGDEVYLINKLVVSDEVSLQFVRQPRSY